MLRRLRTIDRCSRRDLFFFQAEDGIRDHCVTGVQTCALPISKQVAGSDQFHIFGGFAAKNREFIDSIRTGKPMTSSPFSDAAKTMEVAAKILEIGRASCRERV